MPSEDRKRILFVDLSGADAFALRDLLIESGFEVMVPFDHAELCLKLLTWHPDLVLIDGNPHIANMTSLTKVIRSSARVPVPVVLLCQGPPPRSVQAKVMLKPVAFPELLSALREAVDNRDDATQDANAARARQSKPRSE